MAWPLLARIAPWALLAALAAAPALSPGVGEGDTALAGGRAAGTAPVLAREARILETSRDRARLERAAGALAASGDPAELARLESYLKRRKFLARLDDLSDP